ncbi:MAG: DUF72 domain-containing protein [Spirosomataceae bacterium]
MDFGKLPIDQLAQVDFTLPPDHAITAATLQEANNNPNKKPQVFVGCPVWADKQWVGKLYHASAKEKDHLMLYTRQFNTIELNVTHYQIPTEDTILRWKAASNEGFRFCPKFPQIISHDKQLQEAEGLTREFLDSILGLDDHLGMPFLQLAPYFAPRQVKILENYLRQVGMPIAVEFRHPDWFTNPQIWQDTLHMLQSYGAGTVITDVAGRRDVLHQALPTPVATIRFVGNELHPTDYARADAWVQRLKGWFEQGLQQLYLFVHCGTNRYAPELALYWIRALNTHCGLQLPEPRLLPQVVQGSLF